MANLSFYNIRRGSIAAFFRNNPYLKAYYQFSGDTQNLSDKSGNGYSLTNLNSSGFSKGKFGLSFDTLTGNPNTSSGKVLYNSSDIGPGNITVMGWVEPNSETTTETDLGGDCYFNCSKNEAGPNTSVAYGISLFDNNNTQAQVIRFFRLKESVAWTYIDYTFKPKIGKKYFFALTFDGTTLKGYINGELVASYNPSNGNGSSENAIGVMHIGGRKTITGAVANASDAKIEEVAVFHPISLSEQEISAYYNWAMGKKKKSFFLFADQGGGTVAVKSINGLAKASVKTVNGLAIASVKTFNGLG